MLNFALVNASKGKINVLKNSSKVYTILYPCTSTFDCTDYIIHIQPGRYKFELYGPSGGSDPNYMSTYQNESGCLPDSIVEKVKGNTVCRKVAGRGGAGGYTSGVITFPYATLLFATIGGMGQFTTKLKQRNVPADFLPENMIEGGYGGGGSACSDTESHGSGGGQTSLKLLENDLWHRIIVSGGGSDNAGGYYQAIDDGSGGAGGGIQAQSFWIDGTYYPKYEVNSTFGFTFGTGEANQEIRSKHPLGLAADAATDRSGAGAGWFGGFTSNHGNGGSGGGSSWALTDDCIIPEGNITAHDEYYNEIASKPYAFSKNDRIKFTNTEFVAGVWEGNGKMIVTILSEIKDLCPTVNQCYCWQKLFIVAVFIYL